MDENRVLMHYGVKGMKWGVRKEYEKKGRKRSKKTDKKADAKANPRVEALKKAAKMAAPAIGVSIKTGVATTAVLMGIYGAVKLGGDLKYTRGDLSYYMDDIKDFIKAGSEVVNTFFGPTYVDVYANGERTRMKL